MYILTSFIFIRYYHFNPLSLNFLEQEGVEVLVLSDNIDRATQKGFKVCFQTDYQENLGAFLHRYLHRCHRGAGFLPSLVFILNILF